MFENTFQGPGDGTYLDHTFEILLMLLVAFLLGLLLGYILWQKWRKLYEDLDAEHSRLKKNHLEMEKEYVGLQYRLEQSENDNASHRRKISSLEGDLTGLRFRLDKCESDLAVIAAENSSKMAMAAPPANPDNLKKIEGIGPKTEKLCNDIGIWTFEALAQTSTAKLREMLEVAGPSFRLSSPDTWPKQAELAAAAKWEELKAYQDQLDGGMTPSI
jgi:predicted flap endonuclease-1-like 5' DNA nuclease